MRAVFLANAEVVARNSSFESGKPVPYAGLPLSPHALFPFSSPHPCWETWLTWEDTEGQAQHWFGGGHQDDPEHIFIICYVILSLK